MKKQKEQLYDIYFDGIKLNRNTPPMTEKEADVYIGRVLINYGYKPEKKRVPECEQPVRGYFRSNRAWYAKSCDFQYPSVMFGDYFPEEGTCGEMEMIWKPVGGVLTAKLKAFEDAMVQVHKYTDVFRELANFYNSHFTDDQFCEILDKLGFKDFTEYTRNDDQRENSKD